MEALIVCVCVQSVYKLATISPHTVCFSVHSPRVTQWWVLMHTCNYIQLLSLAE